ncbi:H+/Cl- antiporter ClcA [Rhizobium paranaense]|uniref:H+/Cl- antiporter ClcA n=1 Tax=Rhizobium paranaense TaxID=1650438 RepID=A0A7W8XYG8_9HYPH|nr:H+/Cl- antiporter ClcA [Rhizobium paranaense]
MSAFVIIPEMTDDHQAVISVMAVCMIGYVTSRLQPFYFGLSRNFIAAVIRARRTIEVHGRGEFRELVIWGADNALG